MLSPQYTAEPIYEREARELMKQYSAVQRQAAVTAHFSSEQLLLFDL